MLTSLTESVSVTIGVKMQINRLLLICYFEDKY